MLTQFFFLALWRLRNEISFALNRLCFILIRGYAPFHTWLHFDDFLIKHFSNFLVNRLLRCVIFIRLLLFFLFFLFLFLVLLELLIHLLFKARHFFSPECCLIFSQPIFLPKLCHDIRVIFFVNIPISEDIVFSIWIKSLFKSSLDNFLFLLSR